VKQWYNLASFPGLHAQLLSLAVWKAGEGLNGFITWCVPLLMSCTVASHDQSSSNQTRRTNWTEERTEFRERRVKGREYTQVWADWTWCQQRHASHGKSFLLPFFVLQATKTGRGGLGARLGITRSRYSYVWVSAVWPSFGVYWYVQTPNTTSAIEPHWTY